MGDDGNDTENEVGDDYVDETPMKSNDQGFDTGKYTNDIKFNKFLTFKRKMAEKLYLSCLVSF